MQKSSHLISTFDLDKVMCQISACSLSVCELRSWNATESGLAVVTWHFWRGVLEISENVWSLNRCWPNSPSVCCLAQNWLIPLWASVFIFRVYTHQLCHSVDVDLSLLQASAEEHWCCHQEVVSYTVSIDIQRCNLAAVVGANLKEKQMQLVKKIQVLLFYHFGSLKGIPSFRWLYALKFLASSPLFAEPDVVYRWSEEELTDLNIVSKCGPVSVRVLVLLWMLRLWELHRELISHWSGWNIGFQIKNICL